MGAGVIGEEINETVEPYGLYFPPLPSSGDISTIGGMIATDASGQQMVKYGEVGDWVLQLEVVLADGSVVEVGSKAAKQLLLGPALANYFARGTDDRETVAGTEPVATD